MNKYTVITLSEEIGHFWVVVEAKSPKDAWKQYVKQVAAKHELEEEEVENDELVGILEGTPVHYGMDGKIVKND